MDIHLCDNPQTEEKNIMRPHWMLLLKAALLPYTANLKIKSFVIPDMLS